MLVALFMLSLKAFGSIIDGILCMPHALRNALIASVNFIGKRMRDTAGTLRRCSPCLDLLPCIFIAMLRVAANEHDMELR